jgi:lysine-N-methylase
MHKELFTARMIVPAYAAKFRCTGPQCPDHCCRTWEVFVDKDEYKSLRKLSNPSLAKLARHEMEQLPLEQQVEKRYGKIRFGAPPEKNCPFLSQDRLCQLHTQYGEQQLPDTCYSYPRSALEVDGAWRMGLTLSCPEAARLCLLDPGAMHFQEQPVTMRDSMKQRRQPDPALGMQALELHYFFVNLLQTRDYPFWQRLALIAMTCHEVDHLASAGRLAELPALQDSLTRAIVSGEARGWLDPIRPNIRQRFSAGGAMLYKALNQGVTAYYDRIYQSFCVGYKLQNGFEPDAAAIRYEAIWSVLMEPFFAEQPHFLENLFLNQLFLSVFPYGFAPSLLEHCCKILLAKYLMLMMLLTGLAASEGKAFSAEHAMWAVQVLAKGFDHGKQLYELGGILLAGDNPVPGLLTMLAEPLAGPV